MNAFLTRLTLIVPLLEKLVKIGHEVQKEEVVPGMHKCQIEIAEEALTMIQETFKLPTYSLPSNPNTAPVDKVQPIVIRRGDADGTSWQLTFCHEGLYVRKQLNKETFSFGSWNKAEIKHMTLTDGTVITFS